MQYKYQTTIAHYAEECPSTPMGKHQITAMVRFEVTKILRTELEVLKAYMQLNSESNQVRWQHFSGQTLSPSTSTLFMHAGLRIFPHGPNEKRAKDATMRN